MRKPVFRVSDQAVQPHKMARGLKFRTWEVEELYYLCSENKGADQLRGYAKLICVFVFAYAKCWFSHDTAHIPFERKPVVGVSDQIRFKPTCTATETSFVLKDRMWKLAVLSYLRNLL